MDTTRLDQVNAWIQTVSSHFPNLSKPQAGVLALWSFAALMLRSAQLGSCALFLAGLLDERFNSVRQRLKEFYKPASAKSGHQRQELAVESCFAPLLRWALELRPHHQITLALDPTLCRDRFACLCISLVYEGGSIPLAWKILPANQQGAWMPHFKALLHQLSDALPSTMHVIVLGDRGLYSKDLFSAICALGMHPMMRLTKLGQWREHGQKQWTSLEAILPSAGHYYSGRGTMFKTEAHRLEATLIVLWEQGYDQPWYLVTELTPEACEASYYGLRSWIEQGFRAIKSGGMQWEHTRITEPERMQRLWLVYALSLLWSQAVAGHFEAEPEALRAMGLCRSDLFGRAGRRVSRFLLGFMLLLIAAFRQRRLPLLQGLHPAAVPVAAGCRRVQLRKEHGIRIYSENLPL